MTVVLRFIIGTLVGLFGLVGLFLAARASSGDAIYEAGLLVFLFAVLYIFFLIKRGYDLAERREHRQGGH